MISLKTIRVVYLVGHYGFTALVEPSWPTVDGFALVSCAGGWRVVALADMRATRSEAVAEYERTKQLAKSMAQTRANIRQLFAEGNDFPVTMPSMRPDSGDVETIAA
jgi:hypothetical protein